jgi:hypothetical protein
MSRSIPLYRDYMFDSYVMVNAGLPSSIKKYFARSTKKFMPPYTA